MVSVTMEPYQPTITFGPAQPLPAPSLAVPPPNAPIAQLPPSTMTLFPKGGAPVQASPQQQAAYGLIDRMDEVKRKQAEATAGMEDTGAFGRAALRQYGNNMLAIPSVVGDMLTAPARDVRSLVAGEVPQGMFGHVPKLTVEKAAAGARAGQALLAGEDPAAAYDRARANIDLAEGAIQKEFPVATVAGEVAGDFGTLLSGRLPATRLPGITQAKPILSATMPGGFKRYLQRSVENVGTLKRPLLKALEVGTEAASLQILKENDPVNTAALAAGTQLGGSGLLKLAHSPKALIGGGLVGGFLAYFALQKFTPGGDNRWGSALQFTMDHAVDAGLVGISAAGLGAGRYAGSPWKRAADFADDLPKLADSVNLAVRTPAVSTWVRQMQEDINSKTPVIGPVMNALANNTDKFTQQEIDAIGQSFQDGTVKQTIDRLMQNEAFRTKVGM